MRDSQKQLTAVARAATSKAAEEAECSSTKNEHVPFAEGTRRIATEKGVLEYCTTQLYPNFAYDQCLMITGVYRPLNNPRQDYATDLRDIIYPKRKENAPMIIAGDLDISTWGMEYEHWLRHEGIWELANPNTPTHESGATDDAMLFAAGE